MATRKVSVTLEETSLEEARAAAGPRGLSSYLDEALLEKLGRDARRRALIDHLEALEAADPSSAGERARGRARAAELRRRFEP